MKHLTVFQLLFLIFILSYSTLIVAQDTDSNEKVTQRTVQKITRKYLNLDQNKWTETTDGWLFKDQDLGISPLFYTCIADTIRTVEEGTKKSTYCSKEINTSSGHYTTTEPEWSWNKVNTAWYYKGQKTDVYPRAFTEVTTEIRENLDCDGKTTSKITVNSKKEYVISNFWEWDKKRNIWILKDKKINKAPTYLLMESSTTQSTTI